MERDVASHRLNDLNGVPQYFGVSQDVWEAADDLCTMKIHDSFLFKDCLQHNLEIAIRTNNIIDQDMLMEKIIKPAILQTKTLFVDIMSGRIQRSQVVKHLKKKNSESLHKEFFMLRESFQLTYLDNIINVCVSKIHLVLEFDRCLDLSQKVYRVAEKFNFKGDFDNICSVERLVSDFCFL